MPLVLILGGLVATVVFLRMRGSSAPPASSGDGTMPSGPTIWDVPPRTLSSKWSNRSKEKIRQVDPRLQHLMERLINKLPVSDLDDLTIWTGYRDKASQDQKFEEGTSTVRYPNSKHNKQPSQAIDVTPYPEGYNASEASFYRMGQMALNEAVEMGIPVRWGGDWGQNGVADGWDPAHFEIASSGRTVIPHVNKLNFSKDK